MLSEPPAARPSMLERWAPFGVPLGALLGAALVAYGLLRFPTTLTASPGALLGPLGALAMLALYGVAGRVGPRWLARHRSPAARAVILNAALLGGLAAGLVFAAEILLEYLFLPADNSRMGAVEFGLVFLLLFASAFYAAWRTAGLRDGLLAGLGAAVGAALIATLIWYIVVLAVFYAFNGTPQQAQVFQAEGNFADFSRTGMTDFDAWAMQDFLGAGFFHLLLEPLVALFLGLIGAGLGKGLTRLTAPSTS
jgi:hypothetical protein